MATNQALFEAVKTLAAGSIGAAYAAVGSVFSAPMRTIRISNNTDGDLYFSTDGVEDHIFLAAGSFILYDITANSNVRIDYNLPRYTQVYVKEITSPTTGAVYVEGLKK